MSGVSRKEKKFTYRQGVANLRIEGMPMTRAQHRLAMNYQDGKLTHREFVEQALAYARSR
jgi:hypothetical protein